MKRVFYVLLVLLCSGVACAQAYRPKPETRNGKPIYDLDITIVTPGALDALYAAAGDVVQVTISSRESKLVDGWPFTFYTARVIRPYKSGLKAGAVITFSQKTGEVELSDKILRTNGGNPLESGQNYIVFLADNRLTGRALVGERDGAFRLRAGRVEPQGYGQAAVEQRNVTEQQFADEMVRLARRAKPKA